MISTTGALKLVEHGEQVGECNGDIATIVESPYSLTLPVMILPTASVALTNVMVFSAARSLATEAMVAFGVSVLSP